jgi:type I restriction enzyme S subunit
MEVREPNPRYLANKGTHQTEAGQLPADWSAVALADLLISKQLGGNYKNGAAETAWPLIKMGNLGRGRVDVEKIEYVQSSTRPSVRDRLAAGDVLFNTRNTLDLVGKVALWRDELPEAYFNSNIMRMGFDLNRVGSNAYINYVLNTCRCISALRALATGTTSVAAIYSRDFTNVFLPLPSGKPEQHAIAETLTDADALIDSLEQLLTKKRQIKQGAMQELLTGKRRLLQDGEAWRQVPLGSLGRWSGGMTPSMARVDYWSPAEVPWLSSGDLKTAQLSESAKYVSKAAVRDGTTTVVPAKSVVVVMRSGILRKYLPVGITLKPMAINQDLKAIQPNTEVAAEFLLHALTYWGERILATCLKAGTTVESLELRWLKAFTIELPTVSEQVVIAGVLSDMDSEITALEDRLTKARALKQAMAQALLTGRIRLLEPTT